MMMVVVVVVFHVGLHDGCVVCRVARQWRFMLTVVAFHVGLHDNGVSR